MKDIKGMVLDTSCRDSDKMKNVVIIDETEGNPDVIVNLYTFQHEKYIKEAIDSILMQRTRYSWKLLIMDDGSLDKTQQIIRDYQKKYPHRIILAISHSNTHLEFQEDILYKYRFVNYITEMDGDDYWLDQFKLEKQITFLNNHPEYIGVTGNVKNVNEDGSKQHCDFDLYHFQESHIFGKENVLRMEQVSHCSALLFRNFYKNWSFDKFLKVYSCLANGDIVWSSVLGMLGQIYYSHEIYTAHRRVFSGNSWTAQTHGKNYAELLLDMWEDLYKLIFEMFGEKICIENFRKELLARVGKEYVPKKQVDELTKQRNIMYMNDMWLLSKQGEKRVDDVLLSMGIKSIAIYGLSQLGLRLFYELKNSSVEVVLGYDQNPAISIPELMCLHSIPFTIIEKDFDAIVVTALTTYDYIEKKLKSFGYDRVIALDELLYQMIPDDSYLRV